MNPACQGQTYSKLMLGEAYKNEECFNWNYCIAYHRYRCLSTEMIEGHEELMDIASFAEDKQLEVNEWTITIKETIDASSFEKMQKEILSYGPQGNEAEDLKNAVKYSVKNRHKHSDIVESYILIVPKK